MESDRPRPGPEAVLDADPEAERVLVSLWREAGVARRSAAAAAMTRLAMALSRRALRRSMPGRSEDEVAVAFVRLVYGEDLARGVEARLRGRA